MADFQVASVFSDHCVLQREKNVKIFGWGENGKKVTVTFLGKEYAGKVRGERWEVVLPPMMAGNGYEMIIQCENQKVCFRDVAIGEVWLAGGQSNMEFELQNAKGGKEMLANDKEPNVRFYYTQKMAYFSDEFFEKERNTGWSLFGEESARAWSAVGYLFAKKLAKDLSVTVGIIGCNWGGTSATAWMSRESLAVDEEFSSYLKEYDEAVKGKTEEQQIKEYRDYETYNAEWDKKAAECYKEKPDLDWEEVQKICGKNLWPGPMCCINPFRPSGLYECMLKRIIPYTMRGFLYYQGESDDHKPNLYFRLFSRLIQHWREDWEDDTMPFLMVQLPMHRYKLDPDYKHWCLIREAQMRAFQTIKNTGIAVILDCGEFNEIHPKDKVPVGERLELQALYHVYGACSEKEAFGPIYRNMVRREDTIELYFDHAEDGIIVKGDGTGFEIAGEDKVFVPAEAKVDGSRIIVREKNIKNPEYVRYCWTNYGAVCYYGTNGIPMAPFRTSRKDELLADERERDGGIRQVMEL